MRGAAVGVLEQTAVSGSTMTVEEEAMSRMTHVMAAREAMEEATEAMASGERVAALDFGRGEGMTPSVVPRRRNERRRCFSGLGFSDAIDDDGAVRQGERRLADARRRWRGCR